MDHIDDVPTREWGQLRDLAHDGLRDLILDGVMEPGERLDLDRLQDRFGVPVDAIHDAMVALRAEGLLAREPAARQFHVVNPDPDMVGDALRTIGVLIGGVVRQVIPTLTSASTSPLVASVDHAALFARRQEARGHAQAALQFYAALLEHCPNPVLVGLTRASLVPLSYHYLVTVDRRQLNWSLIVASWENLRQAIEQGNQIQGELAIEALHGLPITE